MLHWLHNYNGLDSILGFDGIVLLSVMFEIEWYAEQSIHDVSYYR